MFDAVKMSVSDVEREQLDRVRRADERAAARSERLRERDRDEVDVVEHAVLLHGAEPALAEHAEPVGLVVEQEGVGVRAGTSSSIRSSGAVSPPIE